MRYALLAALVALACRGERAEGTRSETAGPHPEPAVSAAPAVAAADPAPYLPSGISDDELVAFVRWQREWNELLGRQNSKITAISPDPSKPIEEGIKDAAREAGEETARFAPVLQEVMDRQPLKGTKADLVTEVTGGLAHWERTPTGDVRLVIARDEERIGAARRRFGDEAVDDILARESLILGELQ